MFKKILCISSFLLCSTGITATDQIKQPTDFQYLVAHAALAAGYLAYSCIETAIAHEPFAHRYPYAQAWLQEMIIKYPHLHLDQINFVCSPVSMSQGYMAWQSRWNNIYCPQETVAAINTIYQEKLHPSKPRKLVFYEDNTQDDEIDLKIAEFLLLRQVYHWQQSTIFTVPALFCASAVVMTGLCKIIEQNYRDFHTNYTLLSILSGPIILAQIEYHELQADIFAYNQAIDFNVANGAYAYLEQNLADNVAWQLTPNIESRLDAVKYPVKKRWDDAFKK